MSEHYRTAGDRLRARYRDELAGPPNGTEVAMRCTDHGRFIVWVHPPLPPVRIACPPECQAAPEDGPALHVDPQPRASRIRDELGAIVDRGRLALGFRVELFLDGAGRGVPGQLDLFLA